MSTLKHAFIRFKSNNGFDSAAVLSFSTLFAVVPMLTLMFSVFSLSPYFVDLQHFLEEFLFDELLPKNYELVSLYIHQFIENAAKLKGASMLFLFPAAIFLFYEVDDRINSIWNTKKTRHFGIDLLIYLFVLVAGPLLLAGSLFVSSYLGASKLFVFVPMGGIFIPSLPIILSAVGLSLLYYFIPSKKLSFKNALKSGLIVALLLEVSKSILLIYFSYFPVYEKIYGTLSTLLLFMLWVYFMWVLVLFGASASVCLHNQSQQQKQP